jgi:hypothetical protein
MPTPVTETAAPRRIETTLLVLEQFSDPAGTAWRPGDRAPLHRRAVRQAAMYRPELSAVEYATEPVDQVWLAELDKRYDAEYEQAKERRGERKAREQQALVDELKAQDAPQAELERRFKKQEKERADREKRRRNRGVTPERGPQGS